MEILRVFTAGSIDDGKSTLIGRLLYETGSIPKAYIHQVHEQCKRLGLENLDFSFFTDGLKQERERKITMDVAYRYLYTDKYKYILADNPGHLEFARNMLTGASHADIAILLLDAYRGIGTHTLKHLKAIEFLEVPHIILAVNKMDLCDFDEKAFLHIQKEIIDHPALRHAKTHWVPISAKMGDNVVHKSNNMPWYQGAPLLHYLENAENKKEDTPDYSYIKTQHIAESQGQFYAFGNLFNGSLSQNQELFAPDGLETIDILEVNSLGKTAKEYPSGTALNMKLKKNPSQDSEIWVSYPEHFHSTNRLNSELYFCEDCDIQTEKLELWIGGQKRDSIEIKLLNDKIHVKENDYVLGEIMIHQKVFLPNKLINKTFILIGKTTGKTVALGKLL